MWATVWERNSEKQAKEKALKKFLMKSTGRYEIEKHKKQTVAATRWHQGDQQAVKNLQGKVKPLERSKHVHIWSGINQDGYF